MKVTTKVKEPTYIPRTIEITFESEEEERLFGIMVSLELSVPATVKERSNLTASEEKILCNMVNTIYRKM